MSRDGDIFARVDVTSRQGAKDLQRLINLMAGSTALAEDGVIGPNTRKAFASLNSAQRSVATSLSSARGIPSDQLEAERDETQKVSLLIRERALAEGVNPDFAVWVANTESGLKQEAKSPSGKHFGVYQLSSPAVEDVVKTFGMTNGEQSLDVINNVEDNVLVGVRYLVIVAEKLKLNPSSSNPDVLARIYAGFNLGPTNATNLFAGYYTPSVTRAVRGQATRFARGGVSNYLDAVKRELTS